MSLPENNKLARLPQLPIPEPDAARMQADIAASTELFSRLQAGGKTAVRGEGWMSRLRTGLQQFPGWIMPAGAGALALFAAFAVAPSLMQSDLGGPQLRREPAPADSAEIPRRMGMQPPPVGGPIEAPMTVTRYDFDGLALGVRNMPEAVELFLIEGDEERNFDFRIKGLTETFELSDAFVTTNDGAELLLVRLGPQDGQAWEAFERNGADYRLRGQLSVLIGDARSRDEVLARLANTAP